MLEIKGDSYRNLHLEFNGKKVAIITDEYFWKDYIDDVNLIIKKSKQPLSSTQIKKYTDYIASNIMDNIRSWEWESVITDGIYQCQDDYIEDNCNDDEDEDE